MFPCKKSELFILRENHAGDNLRIYQIFKWDEMKKNIHENDGRRTRTHFQAFTLIHTIIHNLKFHKIYNLFLYKNSL